MNSETGLLEILFITFTVGAPVQVIGAVFQWIVQFRLLSNEQIDKLQGLLCILYTCLSAYLLSLVILLLWPFGDELPLLINERLSVPAIIGTALAMPYWLYKFHYLPVRHNH